GNGIFSLKFVHKLVESPDKSEPQMMNALIFFCIGQAVILVMNYIFSKLIVFRKSRPQKEPCQFKDIIT
ncbi:MAG: hypothetical protein LBR54_01540, partial [Oscillospiraceae bacterium]|nr:hypothetical protein [Oscillospiraceae bacterium]